MCTILDENLYEILKSFSQEKTIQEVKQELRLKNDSKVLLYEMPTFIEYFEAFEFIESKQNEEYGISSKGQKLLATLKEKVYQRRPRASAQYY